MVKDIRFAEFAFIFTLQDAKYFFFHFLLKTFVLEFDNKIFFQIQTHQENKTKFTKQFIKSEY